MRKRVHSARLSLSYEIKIIEPNGKVRIFRRRSHSFVIAFMQLLSNNMMTTVGTNVCKDLAGVNQTLRTIGVSGAMYMDTDTGAGDTSTGIVVGSGTTAPAPSDYKLATKIAHGTGAGQLQYGVCATNYGLIAGGDVVITVTRTFTNGSGATVTIREIGIDMGYTITTGSGYFLVIRDLVSPAKDVPNGSTAVVTYKLQGTT